MKTMPLISLLIATLFLCNSCNFQRLKKEKKEAESTLAVLEGEILSDTTSKNTIIVAIFDSNDSESVLHGHRIMYTPGRFRFIVEAPNTYDLVAFEDQNGDFIYQYGEPAGICHPLTKHLVQAGQELQNLDITLNSKTHLPDHIDINAALSNTTIVAGDITISLGEKVRLDDPRFTEKNASLGLWQPLRFLREVGFGIYFLDPYDPDKIPVIFIHGSSGYPGIWNPLVNTIDQSKFQRWVCFYPSGLRLSLIGEALCNRLTDLQTKYNFSELVIVTHSMGGLVSKDIINHLVERDSPIKIPLFVTLSTPWGGHEAAQMGVKHAPAVIPCWLDMVPDSPFINELWQSPLPDETRHVLLFSYKGENSRIMDRNNDGTVTIESQLSLKAQEDAKSIRGFNANHVGILSDPQALEYFRSLMDEGPF